MNEGNMSNEIEDFLNLPELQKILTDYMDASKECDSAGFNIFTLISDYYYKEKFHGDIINAFLDPKGKHGEGDKFLKLFLNMIGIEEKNYGADTSLEREKSNIDFLIKNNDKGNDKHCIIIENKLYDAQDQPRQLCRYYEEMKENQNYKNIDAIVYLPMSLGNYPDIDKEYADKIDPILKVIPANDFIKSNKSLINDWVRPCILAAKYANSKEILNQYANLLESLQPESLKYKSIINLRNFLCGKDDETLEKTLDIIRKIKVTNSNDTFSKMLDELKEQLVNSLILNSPSSLKPKKHPTCKSCCVVELGEKREIYTYCAEEDLKYRMRIIKGGYIDNGKSLIDTSLQEELFNRECKEDKYIEYNLNEEDKLISMIESLVEYYKGGMVASIRDDL